MLGASACGRTAPPQAPPPPEVGVLTLAQENVPESFEFSGSVVPYRRVEVRSRVDGIIESRPFTEGAMVRPGQVLYRLDRVRYEAAYQSALARYQNAKQTLDRMKPLLAQNAVAQQDVDNAQSEFQAAQAALAQARKDLDDTVVRAEMAGRVGRTNLEVGARVTGPADLLTTIDRLDPVYVTFSPSSQQLLAWQQDSSARALIRPGSKLNVQVVLPDGSVLPRVGKLDYVAPALDASTGTREFRATFQNKDGLLTPGQFVRVRLTGFVRPGALAIPQAAVQTGLGKQFVYVVSKGDTAMARDVVPGPWTGNRWVIEKGLAPGERVIVSGLQKVAPGQPVRPVEASDASAAAPAAAAPDSSQAGSSK